MSQFRDDRPDFAALWRDYTTRVEVAARGQWHQIIWDLASNLHAAITENGRNQVPCPINGGVDRLRIFQKDFAFRGAVICNCCGAKRHGFNTLRWANSWTYSETVEEVGNWLGMSWDDAKQYKKLAPRTDLPPPAEPLKSTGNPTKRLDSIKAVHAGCHVIDWTADSPVTRYFKRRGNTAFFNDPPDDLLEHPGLALWRSEPILDRGGKPVLDSRNIPKERPVKVGVFPAMIGVLRNGEGKIVTLHRHYLNEDGSPVVEPDSKGGFKKVKKLMPPPFDGQHMGCAIRLYSGRNLLGLSEGIETAMAARQYARETTGLLLPFWATVTAGMMEAVEIGDEIDEVYCYADNDDPVRNKRREANGRGRGEDAAFILRERYLEKTVKILVNPRIDEDWEDEFKRLLEQRAELYGASTGGQDSGGAREFPAVLQTPWADAPRSVSPDAQHQGATPGDASIPGRIKPRIRLTHPPVLIDTGLNEQVRIVETPRGYTIESGDSDVSTPAFQTG